MDAAVGVSRAKDGQAAGRAAVRQACERLGGAEAGTVMLFATTTHADPRALVAAATEAAGDARVVGCAAAGVLTGEGEVEEGPAVAALALAGAAFTTRPFAVAGADDVDRVTARLVTGVKRGLCALLTDGYSGHPALLAGYLAEALPADVPVVGGLATGPAGPAPAYRWLDGEISAHGAAGLIVETDTPPIIGVAQGCRLIGEPLTVTASKGNVIAALDGQPAFAAFARVARPLLEDLPRASQVVFLAVLHGDAPNVKPDGAERYAIRGLAGFDPERGLLAVTEPLPVGTRLSFAVRDGSAAREHLRSMIADVRRRLAGRAPRFGLYFNCAGRGRSLYGVEDHDMAFIQGELGKFPLLGMFGGGELGPAGPPGAAPGLLLFSGVLAVVA